MKHILPSSTLGILGGGQLGRMFTLAAHAMGYQVAVLDPDPESPAGLIADHHIRTQYDDYSGLDRLAGLCSAVTTEFENVPADSLRYLAGKVRVSPDADCVFIAQDRIREKSYINETAGLAVAPFRIIETDQDLMADLTGYLPGILKLARFGYDGKGQIRVSTGEEVRDAFAALGQKPCVLERLLDLKTEISVIVARTDSSRVKVFPVSENQHEAGILDISIVPARVEPAIASAAQNMALKLADRMNYIGVLAVEFFVLDDHQLVINEIAPRPHNSGHFTLDACVSSQFEQQVRTMCGLPPGDTRLLSPVVMVNLLGDIWKDDEPAFDRLLSEPNVILHLYGKKTARAGRKMGHFNVLSETVSKAYSEALALKHVLQE